MKTIENAKYIVQTLLDHGYLAYFAGGWVRDYLMGHPSNDVDIATDAPPEKIVELFPKTVCVGIAFGVVVVIHHGHQFEVSTFRRDLEYEDGRRPKDIELSTPFEDAQRRDFTINGMFYDPIHKKILDYVGGEKDIEHRIVRTIGEPSERFKEDRLRMIRAVRFATRFNFAIHDMTQAAILQYADTLFPAVAIERVWQELKKMAEGPHFDRAILWLHELGLLNVMFPILGQITREELESDLQPLQFFPEKVPAVLRLMVLFYDFPLDKKSDLCRSLKMSNHDLQIVEFAHHVQELSYASRVKGGGVKGGGGKDSVVKDSVVKDSVVKDSYVKGCDVKDSGAKDFEVEDVDWVHIYAHSKAQICLDVVAAGRDDRVVFLKEHHDRKNRLQLHVDRLIQRVPLVNSERLRKEGISAGKVMGLLLKESERIAVNEDLNDPDEVISRLKKMEYWPK